MAAVGNAMFGLAGMLLKPFGSGRPAPIAAPVVPTNNMAEGLAMQSDALRRRRGAGANELTGGGAEAATPGGKVLLGQ